MLIRLLCIVLFGVSFFSCKEKRHKIPFSKKSIPCEYCLDSSDFPAVSEVKLQQYRAEIEQYFKTIMDTQSFNGGFLVAKNGVIIFESYSGYSSVKNNRYIKPSTPLHLASVGKVLTATAIFRLIEMKKLYLDKKIKTILPQFPYPDITVRMLLNHRSGVPKYANFTSEDSIWSADKTLRNKDILNLLAKHRFPLDFEPNTKFVYNNSNFALLALVVEKIARQPFHLAMEELVFEPLGMKNSFVFLLDRDKNNVSQSYSSRLKIQAFDYLDAIYGDKNIYSTPRDLLKFDLAMQKDDFISKKLKKEIFKGYSYEKAGIKNYGLGIRLKEWDTGQKIFYHNGWWHGNTSCYVTLKKEGVTLIAISNKYTRKVYDIIRLSSLFGDYPFEIEEDEESETTIVLPPFQDSLAK